MIKNHISYLGDWQFTVTDAKESYIWDHNKRRLIDFSSGWNVANLGWNNREIAEAMITQIGRNVYVPTEMGEKILYKYAKYLLNTLPKELNVVCRATGGAEAIEQALKIARASTKRKKILGFQRAYHGQTFGALSVSFKKQDIRKILPLVPGFIQLQFPSDSYFLNSKYEVLTHFFEQLENILRKKDIAAIVTEPGIITGFGSALTAPKGFLSGIRRLTQQYGTLLILDEVGTGFSRTGKLFAMEHEGVIPDILVLAKAISNGAVPISVTICNKKRIENTQAETMLHSTFGWSPLACAASLATLKIHIRDKIWEQADIKGNWIREEMMKQVGSHPKVGSIRGIGMEIGLVFVQNKKTMKPDNDFAQYISHTALENGLYLITGNQGSIQIMPPLTTPWEVLEEGVRIIVRIIKQAKYE